MKTILLATLLIISCISAKSQSFITLYDSSTAAYTIAGTDVKVNNNIKSASADSIYIKWHITSHNLGSWVLAGFCDNVTCYGASNDLLNGVPNVSKPYYNQYNTFYALFNGDAAPANSSAYIRVHAMDTVNAYSKTLTYVATKGTTGVTNVTRYEDEIVLYPNPARNNINILFDAAAGVKNISIYNLIGKVVSIYKVNGNSAKLEINDLPFGVYYVRLVNTKGQVIGTRKFTKQ